MARRWLRNLFVSVREGDPKPPVTPEGGAFMWRQKLRDGRCIALHVVNLPLADFDLEDIARMRREGPTIGHTPKVGEDYAEIASFRPRPDGNAVIIVPLRLDSYRV
jgi:hypothetical protein